MWPRLGTTDSLTWNFDLWGSNGKSQWVEEIIICGRVKTLAAWGYLMGMTQWHIPSSLGLLWYCGCILYKLGSSCSLRLILQPSHWSSELTDIALQSNHFLLESLFLLFGKIDSDIQKLQWGQQWLAFESWWVKANSMTITQICPELVR